MAEESEEDGEGPAAAAAAAAAASALTSTPFCSCWAVETAGTADCSVIAEEAGEVVEEEGLEMPGKRSQFFLRSWTAWVFLTTRTTVYVMLA